LATPDSRSPSSLRRVAIIYGSVLVVVGGVVAALLVLTHSSGTPRPPSTSTTPTAGPPVGNFSFAVKDVRVVPTGKTAGTKKAGAAAAKRIERTMDALYFEGYLDPSAWQNGSYDAAWKLFARAARARAQKDEPNLTLGADAGSRYSAVTAGPNAAFVRVLMDRAGRPATALVTVRFSAKAAAKDGTTSVLTSSGQYYLVPGPAGWAITGYTVKRGTA
jgi:hypothetical protein